MKRFSWLLIVLFLLPLTALFGSDLKLVKSLDVPAGSNHTGSIVSFGGEIDIAGRVEKSLILIGGRLRLTGQIDEDVICIGTRVHIAETGHIKGDLLVIGGELDRDPLSRVKGEFFYFRFDLKKIENTLIPILSDARTITFLKIIKIVIWFIIALLVLLLLPDKVFRAEEIFAKNILKCGLIGLISLFIFLLLLVFFIVLSFLIIGIPLLLGLIALYFLILILGRTAMFYFIGRQLWRFLFRKEATAPALLVLLGALLYGVLKFLPLLGPFVLGVINVVELGIGVAFVFGRRLNLKL